MKLQVKTLFRDKNDHVTEYPVGTILDVKDKERADDLVKRGLCSECKGKKAVDVTLGEESEAASADAAPAESANPEKSEGAE